MCYGNPSNLNGLEDSDGRQRACASDLDFYAKKLAERQWTKAAKDNLQRNFWVQTFSKGEISLEVRVDGRGEGSEVRLTPKGMMWEEDDQPTPKDLPLPEGSVVSGTGTTYQAVKTTK